ISASFVLSSPSATASPPLQNLFPAIERFVVAPLRPRAIEQPMGQLGFMSAKAFVSDSPASPPTPTVAVWMKVRRFMSLNGAWQTEFPSARRRFNRKFHRQPHSPEAMSDNTAQTEKCHGVASCSQ